MIQKAPRAGRATTIGTCELLALYERDYLRTLYQRQRLQMKYRTEALAQHPLLGMLHEKQVARRVHKHHVAQSRGRSPDPSPYSPGSTHGRAHTRLTSTAPLSQSATCPILEAAPPRALPLL